MSSAKPAILMTGSHGFLGTILSRYLSAQGFRIFHGDFDITQPQHIAKFTGQCPEDAVVMHLAGMSTLADCERDPVVAHRVNCEGAVNVFKGFPKARHFIYFSSGQVYKAKENGKLSEDDPIEPTTVYAQTKRAAEIKLQDLASQAETGLTVLRIFNHVHKTQAKTTFMSRIYHSLLEMRPPESSLELRVGNLDLIRDLGAVQDLNLAVAKILDQASVKSTTEIYNIASGAGKNLRRIVELLAQKVGVQPELRPDQSLFRQEAHSIVGDSSRFCTRFNWHPQAVNEERLVNLFVSDLMVANSEK